MEKELYFIIAVVFIQIVVFFFTLQKIWLYRKAINKKKNITIENKKISIDTSDSNTPLIDNYLLISDKPSPTFKNIQESINEYLKNNKGASADMSILKNIIDRDIEKLENEITNLTPLPLYLGLIGTMLGIIFGLFQIPSVGNTSFLQGLGIDVLIDGVKYAMIASVIGITFTSILSGWFLRRAKFVVEGNYNDFLTLLETKLLPSLKEDVSTNLTNLYHNLATFNAGFSKSVTQLQGMMNKNYDALVTQDRILDNLQRVNVNKLANANVKVFDQMERLMPQFNMMNSYVKGINQNIQTSKELSDSLNDILTRTNEVSDITSFIKESTSQAVQLNELVETHFKQLEDRTNALTKSSIVMEDEAKRTVSHFKEYIEEQIKALREITLKEEDLLIHAFEKNRDVLGKLNELTGIKEELKALKSTNEQNISNSDLVFELREIRKAIEKQKNKGSDKREKEKIEDMNNRKRRKKNKGNYITPMGLIKKWIAK